MLSTFCAQVNNQFGLNIFFYYLILSIKNRFKFFCLKKDFDCEIVSSKKKRNGRECKQRDLVGTEEIYAKNFHS